MIRPTILILAAAATFGTILCLPPSGLRFEDVAAQAGVRAEMRCGSAEKRWIPEANGSGAAWLDYDNDGWMDLLIVNGSTMEQLRKTIAGQPPPAVQGGVFLYRNLGNGKFEDVTDKAGLVNGYWATGANAADYNNDGHTDILITTIGRDLLYRNNGNGTFTEVGESAGLSRDVAWHTGSAFGDFDGDGYLDLYVAAYIDVRSFSFKEPAPVCDYMGLHVFCGPVGLPGTRGVLYRNNGNGTFSDVTRAAGLANVRPSHGFTPLADDFNQDGRMDIFVANDSDPNQLFLNQGGLKFQDAAVERGVAFNGDGRAQSNMGVAAGDYNNEGRISLLTTTFHHDYFPLFKQDKSGFFDDVSASTGLATVTAKYLGWAAGFTDFNNDGALELWTANGHVYPTSPDYFQPVTVFQDRGRGFSLEWSFPGHPNNSYRGGCAGDFDNDGKMDLLILPIAGHPVLLHNLSATEGASWIGLTLRGTRSNRDAIGASVKVETCGKTLFDTVRNGGSYLSRNDPRLHFGLGGCTKVDRVTIRWPRGTVQIVKDIPVNHYTTIEEPR